MGISDSSTVVITVRAILNTILHQLVAVITVYSCWGALLDGSQLAWHVILCTLGVTFITKSLILIATDNVYTQHFEDKHFRYLLHAITSLIGSILLIIGLTIEIERKSTHFNTTHGVIGLVFLLFLFLSIICGVLARFSKALTGYFNPVYQKLTHNLLGIFTYMLAIAGLCTGFYTDYFVSAKETKMAATIVSCIICAWSLQTSFHSLYKQIRHIFG